MPLTFAHPAAVLPLVRGPLVPAALVAGSVAPDAPYFLRAAGVPVSAQSWYEPFLNATTSHSVQGLLTVDLPPALAGYLWWLCARRPARSLLPVVSSSTPTETPTGTATPTSTGTSGAARDRNGLRSPGDRVLPRRAARLLWVVVSSVLGVITHLVWDAVTHGDGYVVQHVPGLDEPAVAGVTWARGWEHLNSVLGLVVLAVLAWRSRKRVVVVAGGPGHRRRWVVVAVAVGCALLAAGLHVHRSWGTAGTGGTAGLLENVLSDAVKGAGAGSALAVVVGVAVWWVHHLVTGARARPCPDRPRRDRSSRTCGAPGVRTGRRSGSGCPRR